jgi:hypothetical protein
MYSTSIDWNLALASMFLTAPAGRVERSSGVSTVEIEVKNSNRNRAGIGFIGFRYSYN